MKIQESYSFSSFRGGKLPILTLFGYHGKMDSQGAEQMSESVITIRGSKPKTQTKKESLAEKIRNYNKRHSLNNTSSKRW